MTKDRIKFGTLSRVLGSWVTEQGHFVFRELGRTGNWGLLEENTLGFRKLGARKRFLGS